MKEKIISGVVGVLLATFLLYLWASTTGLLAKQLSDSQIEEIALQFVNTASTRNVLIERLYEDGRFIGQTGPEGLIGESGPGWEPQFQDYTVRAVRDDPKQVEQNIGPHRFCALTEATTSHHGQACGCRITQSEGNWTLNLTLDETVRGACSCRAGCFD